MPPTPTPITIRRDNRGALAPNSRAHVPGVSAGHANLGAHQFHGLVLAAMLCQELLHLSLVVLLLGVGDGRVSMGTQVHPPGPQHPLRLQATSLRSPHTLGHWLSYLQTFAHASPSAWSALPQPSLTILP